MPEICTTNFFLHRGTVDERSRYVRYRTWESTVAQSTGTALIAYCLVGGIALGGLGGAATVLGKATSDSQSQAKTKTVLEVQVESAREIREALARPVAGPEPLPPISSKLSKPETKIAEAKVDPQPKPKRPKVQVVRQAREVFASIEPPPQPQPFFQFMAFGPGRH
jgi:hypothetical protein